MNKKCPTCGSPKPHYHPALQLEGEVQLCADAYHRQVTSENTPTKIAELVDMLPIYHPGFVP